MLVTYLDCHLRLKHFHLFQVNFIVDRGNVPRSQPVDSMIVGRLFNLLNRSDDVESLPFCRQRLPYLADVLSRRSQQPAVVCNFVRQRHISHLRIFWHFVVRLALTSQLQHGGRTQLGHPTGLVLVHHHQIAWSQSINRHLVVLLAWCK